MIKASFGQHSLRLTSDKNGKSCELLYADHPAIFCHPRLLIGDFDQAEYLVRESLKKMRESWIINPKVLLAIEKPVAGGLTDTDRRYLKELFTHAGAREVVIFGEE